MQNEVGAARGDVGRAKQTVSTMTPANVEAKKPVATEQLNSADRHLGAAAEAGVVTADMVEKDAHQIGSLQKENAELKASDPVRTWLRVGGFSCVALGVLALVASIVFTSVFKYAWIRPAAVGLIVAGVIFISIAYFLTQIYWIIGFSLIGLAIAAGVWIWMHRKLIQTKIDDLEGWVFLGDKAPPTSTT